ncbi:MAG: hypothetical protein IJ128_05865, partial [Firmicutes bacterium]|nr:hypothetical protein [Bacillota bacterium]
FGDLATMDSLITSAHERGIKVTMDLVPNHTSDQHEWFKAALASAPGSAERARDIFRDGKKRADKQAQQIIEEANQKASDIVKRSDDAAELEKAKAMDELRQEIVDMVIMAAEQVVEHEIEKEGHQAIIDDVIDKARKVQWQN